MKGRFDLWPKVFHETPLEGYCVICVSPCSEPGWVKTEGVNIVVCRCCIEMLVAAMPPGLVLKFVREQAKPQGEN